ncbi:Peptidyl-prolyl cis-trans isomerase [Plasmodiophora brassicae]|uniref:Peptidyl-prolyl cis-trans isomerase n=1 Tax=Plasmodiophora brassicae TaxID=37360 RepID=A0A0G4J0B9_PLABS|nr:hypothetical protein PBRA_008091 [Plasmodiophora brassicae]SPQ99386.1 unnamed protein product [Plasmodiophora brassicae]
MSGEPDERGNVALETSMGDIEVELYWNEAPLACQNFYGLAKRQFYDNVPFHRICKEFVIQGGDPTGTGRGGSSIWDAPFQDELTPALRHTGAGIVSMANSGPNTNKSQFFITLAPTPWLDGKHTIFGRVSSGMKVVRRMSLVQVDGNDRPVEDIRIHRARCLPVSDRDQ